MHRTDHASRYIRHAALITLVTAVIAIQPLAGLAQSAPAPTSKPQRAAENVKVPAPVFLEPETPIAKALQAAMSTDVSEKAVLFYGQRAFAPIWFSAEGMSEKGIDGQALIDQARELMDAYDGGN